MLFDWLQAIWAEIDRLQLKIALAYCAGYIYYFGHLEDGGNECIPDGPLCALESN